MSSHQVIVIGAGIAGAATAWSLKQAGFDDVVIVEKEPQAGLHSSSRNAAILRTAIEQPALAKLATESADFYRQAPSSFCEQPLVEKCGLYITVDKDGDSSWMPKCANASMADIRQHYPWLANHQVDVWHFANEGVVDIHSLLHSFLRNQSVHYNFPVDRLLIEDNRVIGVQNQDQKLLADKVVIANGGWANEFCIQSPLNNPFRPHRRHLMVSAAMPDLDPYAPVVWATGTNEFYFRPESGGILISACDHELVDPRYGENIDPNIIDRIATKAEYWLPHISEVQPKHLWSGLRTFGADNHFAVGPDPGIDKLYWVAGLAGHGMSTAYAVGQIISDWIVHDNCNHPSAGAVLPQRLIDLPSFATV
ncbi:MAG: FAD-dependent oxidoreductase [Planctomycetota bacterium]|jgi:glycine/D-amino acid oxidase-like deaminating enzyme|nr:FAD-dependent oxidoreductase [Planctomycetota bacterium]